MDCLLFCQTPCYLALPITALVLLEPMTAGRHRYGHLEGLAGGDVLGRDLMVRVLGVGYNTTIQLGCDGVD